MDPLFRILGCNNAGKSLADQLIVDPDGVHVGKSPWLDCRRYDQIVKGSFHPQVHIFKKPHDDLVLQAG